jgi:hypothetical protein
MAKVARALIVTGFLVLVGTVLGTHPHASTAARTCNLTKLTNGYQYNMNYDFTSKSINQAFSSLTTDGVCASGVVTTNVDWADSILFYDSAITTDVGKNLTGYTCTPAFACDPEHGHSGETYGSAYWDDAQGIKDATASAACFGSSNHMRIHGIPGGASNGGSGFQWNENFGYWVWATTHVDHNEVNPGPCPAKWFGEEDVGAANMTAAAAKNQRVVAVFPNCCNLYNAELPRVDGDHHWENDGRATYIHVRP